MEPHQPINSSWSGSEVELRQKVGKVKVAYIVGNRSVLNEKKNIVAQAELTFALKLIFGNEAMFALRDLLFWLEVHLLESK